MIIILSVTCGFRVGPRGSFIDRRNLESASCGDATKLSVFSQMHIFSFLKDNDYSLSKGTFKETFHFGYTLLTKKLEWALTRWNGVTTSARNLFEGATRAAWICRGFSPIIPSGCLCRPCHSSGKCMVSAIGLSEAQPFANFLMFTAKLRDPLWCPVGGFCHYREWGGKLQSRSPGRILMRFYRNLSNF